MDPHKHFWCEFGIGMRHCGCKGSLLVLRFIDRKEAYFACVLQGALAPDIEAMSQSRSSTYRLILLGRTISYVQNNMLCA